MSELPASRDLAAGSPDRTELVEECLLHSVVVTYREGADQVTVYPRRDSCCDQMEAWLTANAEVFVTLDEMR
ncbi:hypothetical protein ACFQJC_09480 [Haloferax namakaokahaiae]|uniref:DUF7511 domain-containing protein n=1 Tax=Haloferax namakaokahaiae TaxID=1748331 RepID=A0ABD5ZEW7_9EURY